MADKVVVKCDACETKNMVDPSRAQEARCGRCKNPLLDAFMEQYGEEGDDGLFGEEEEGDGDDDDDEQHRCFGCGKDYQKNWSDDDLSTVMIEGVSKGQSLFQVCPDCMDEVKQQYKVVG